MLLGLDGMDAKKKLQSKHIHKYYNIIRNKVLPVDCTASGSTTSRVEVLSGKCAASIVSASRGKSIKELLRAFMITLHVGLGLTCFRNSSIT